MIEYPFQKATVDLGQLTAEVNASAIAQDVLSMDWGEPDTLIVRFESALNQGDQDILSALVVDHGSSGVGRYQDNHYKKIPATGLLLMEEWYESIDTSAGTLTGLAKRKTYTYSGGHIISAKEETFFKNGVVASTQDYRCWSDGSNYIEEKVI